MRLNNYISSTGLCSRREADKLIEQGKVTVNGKKAQVGQTVEEGAMVKVNNKLIKPKNNNIYIHELQNIIFEHLPNQYKNKILQILC